MTPKRSYYWVGIPYAAAGLAFFVWAASRAEWTASMLPLAPLIVVALATDFWSSPVSSRLRWSTGSLLFPGILLLSPDSSAPVLGSALGLASGFMDVERRFTQPGRMLVNSGASAISWGAAGLLVELIGHQFPGPDWGVVIVLALVAISQLATSAALIAGAAGTVFGRKVALDAFAAIGLFGPRAVGFSIAVGTAASVIVTAGWYFLPLSLATAAGLASVPALSARISVHSRDVAMTLTRIANVDHLAVSEETHTRLVALSETVGLRLGLERSEIDQLLYLSTLLTATDSYAAFMPRSFEQEFAGEERSTSIWPLIAGMPLDDLADPHVVTAAQAIATLSDWPATRWGSIGLSSRDREEIERELLTQGVPPSVCSALLDSTQPGRAYQTIMHLHPTSVLAVLYRRRRIKAVR